MSYHSQLRLSWYFPLTELLLNKNLVKQEHQWLIKPGTTRISEFDNFSSEIKHFESIGFGNRFGYPLLIKDRRIRIVYDIDFPPLYYATTRQKKISFQINSSSTSNILTNEDLRIRTLRAQLKLYPVGFGSIALFFTFDEIINSKILTNIEKNWTYGKKKLSINAFSQYLKVLIIHSLFKQEAINDIQLQLNGHKVRASIIGPDYSVKDFQIFTKDILSPNKKTSSISYHFNEEKKDQIAFHKTGITQFQSIELSTGTRRYCRNNLDYILDLIYGSEILFTLLPKKFTQYDLRKRTNKDFLRAIHAPFFTLNPYVLTNENENQNTLPSAALRIWFKKLLNAVNLKKKYNNFLETMMIKFREFRIDRWY
ncbi:MAG: hypothetical protein U9O98_02860, partial [Asgard group archaeon]|nr:hypothetical protein [Asgard group archaeon]